jgi:hypothetical protein
VARFGAGPAAQGHDSKVVAVGVVGRAVVRTCLAGEACVDAALVAVDSSKPAEQNMMSERLVAMLSHPAFATDAHMSHLSSTLQLRDVIKPGALQGRRCYSATTPGKGHKPIGDGPQAMLWPVQGGL